MTINTKKVAGRRDLHYSTLQDVLADAQELAAAGSVQTLGNWTPAQVFEHLAKAFEMSLDGATFQAPLPLRWVAQTFLKKNLLTKGVPSGFKANGQVMPGDVPTEEGLAHLEDAVGRYLLEPQRAKHPLLGNLSQEEWTQFHLRHCEMHMSFLKIGVGEPSEVS
ncbi:DUF1569 domain-containing protein [Bremerella sp. P1]|uniref:DUF1569 domain-containing protein n=1 Tax=Bremerella sp. P1 TaxID=3026424 RepID=UPI002367D442|nr:DUF1569 domain-containing protein [Bremerella sp. P1]WDI43927.1 DUF1569 domain-containing protein [Bremerella sp. P1]